VNRSIILSILLSLTIGSSLVAMTPAKKAQADRERNKRAEAYAARRAQALAKQQEKREEKGARSVPATPGAHTGGGGKRKYAGVEMSDRIVAARSSVAASAPEAARLTREIEAHSLPLITQALTSEQPHADDGETKDEKRSSTSEYIPSEDEKKLIRKIKELFTGDHHDIRNIKESLGEYFFQAAKEGFLAALKMCIEKGVDIDQQSITYHETALNLAVQWGKTVCIKALIAAGANVTLRNYCGETILHTDRLNPDLTKVILTEYSKKGGNLLEFVSIQNKNGDTALYIALDRALRYERPLDEIETSINTYLRAGLTISQVMNLLIRDHKTLFYNVAKLSFADHRIITSLYSALVNAGASYADITAFINCTDSSGNTALHFAVEDLNNSTTQRLLSLPEIDTSIKNREGKTARDLNPEFFDRCAQELNEKIALQNAARNGPIMDHFEKSGYLPKELAKMVVAYSEDRLISVGEVKPAEPNTPGLSWAVHTEQPHGAAEEKDSEYVAECYICDESVSKNHAKTLRCGHIFHTSCIGEWQAINNTCPHEACEKSHCIVTNHAEQLATIAAEIIAAATTSAPTPQPSLASSYGGQAIIAKLVAPPAAIALTPPAPTLGLGLDTEVQTGAVRTLRGEDTTATWVNAGGTNEDPDDAKTMDERES